MSNSASEPTTDLPTPISGAGARTVSEARSGTVLHPGEAPPPNYYANNLLQLAGFVQDRFGPALDESMHQCLIALARLPGPAIRLLARLVGRKGSVFRLDNLAYPEVPDCAAAVTALVNAGLVTIAFPVAADRLLGLAKVAELASWFPHAFTGRKRWRKDERIAALLNGRTDQQLRQQLGVHLQWLTLTCLPAIERAQRLYFGGRHQDLTAFVTEDLGLIRYPNYEQSMPDWWDGSAAALLRHEQLQRWSSHSHRVDASCDDSLYAQELAAQLLALPVSREQAHMRDRALLRLGQYFERRGLPEQALATYAPVQRHPARERRVRLLAKDAQQQASSKLLGEIAAAPWCAAEADFAERFGKRIAARYALTELSLIGPTEPHIESFAAALLLADGGDAWHVENRLPLGIAGLLYWDVVYAPVVGAFTRPFQVAPNDLRWDDFTAVRSAQLQQAEAQWGGEQCRNPDALVAQLQRTLRTHQGTANPLVSWQLFDEPFVAQLVAAFTPPVLARLAHFVIRQLGRYHNGFPDLLIIYPDNRFECVEVKGPGDQLQGAQRRWLDQLAALEIPARVFKLRPTKQ